VTAFDDISYREMGVLGETASLEISSTYHRRKVLLVSDTD
jgi:hypothetical protein